MKVEYAVNKIKFETIPIATTSPIQALTRPAAAPAIVYILYEDQNSARFPNDGCVSLFFFIYLLSLFFTI